MIKYVASLVAFAASLGGLGAGVSRADDTGMLPTPATLTWERLLIRPSVLEGGELNPPADSDVLRQRLNAAACECSRQGIGDTDLYYEISVSAETNSGRTFQEFTGVNCVDDELRDTQCEPLMSLGDIDTFFTPKEISFRLFDIINPRLADDQPCRAEQGDATVWLTSDTDGDSLPDFFSPRPLDLTTFTDVAGFDTKAPPALDNLRAEGGEESIQIKWDIPEGSEEDLYKFQAFCMASDGSAPVTGVTPAYSTVNTVCGLPTPAFALAAIPVASEDGTEIADAPEAFKILEPGFLCGTQDSATATSLTIDGLENNVEYTVAIVAIDFYGNPTGAFFTRTIVPKPVTDFWEDVHDRGGKIEGGFCSSTGSPASAVTLLVVLGLAWGLRRRRARWAVASTLVLALALAPRAARADDFTPYWEDDASADAANQGDGAPKWNAGIKLGPYTPAIDAQIGKNAVSGMGPYQAMFGNYWIDGEPTDSHVYQILPMLDVDRFLWSGSGQFGIGGSLGYMQKSAYAYVDGSSPDDPRRPRSTAGRNTFRLIPFALTATYRATQLDDLYGIPIVPYVRGGLSYYVWWLKGPTGEISKVCKDGSMDANCETNKAYGGSLGFQGSLGLAVRAERIDSDAARSMVQSGIYHAGFYAELMYAVVDGFGSDKKLSVGDKTWFAGINFEF
jgi:MYXO-CTERM domain-containing protein